MSTKNDRTASTPTEKALPSSAYNGPIIVYHSPLNKIFQPNSISWIKSWFISSYKKDSDISRCPLTRFFLFTSAIAGYSLPFKSSKNNDGCPWILFTPKKSLKIKKDFQNYFAIKKMQLIKLTNGKGCFL